MSWYKYGSVAPERRYRRPREGGYQVGSAAEHDIVVINRDRAGPYQGTSGEGDRSDRTKSGKAFVIVS